MNRNMLRNVGRIHLIVPILAAACTVSIPAQTISTFAGTTWSFPALPIPAPQAPLGQIAAVATGPGGSFYISDTSNQTLFKIDSSGNLSSVLSNFTSSAPGLAVDPAGNVLFLQGNQVKRVSPLGAVSVFAGNVQPGNGGDGGSALMAFLRNPSSVFIDSQGIVFIADTGNSEIWKITLDGIIHLVAGTGTAGEGGDGGPPLNAQLNSPMGVATDASGNIYIADSKNFVIRVITAGKIQIFAGTKGMSGYSGDGGPAVNSKITQPQGLAIDGSGNVYFVDPANFAIREILSSGPNQGFIFTVAGTGNAGYVGDGGPAKAAQLSYPSDAALDAAGNVLIADTSNERVRSVAPDGTITTIAGNGGYRFSGDGGSAVSAVLNSPVGLAVNSLGAMLTVDMNNNRVRSVDLSSGTITTIVGTGTRGYSGDGQSATLAAMNLLSFSQNISGIAVDPQGNVLIADTDNNVIRKVALDGTITTVAGNGIAGFSGDGGPATGTSLSAPNDVAVDALGNIYIADTSNCRIRLVVPAGTISTFAGTGNCGYNGDNVPATFASVSFPRGVSVDPSGNVYIADTQNFIIRKVNSGTITTVAGTPRMPGSTTSGPAVNAKLSSPKSIAVDSVGNFLIADSFNNWVQRVTLSDGNISVVAGTGVSGVLGDGGPATAAQLSSPSFLAFDTGGNLFIGDTGNGRIREVTGLLPPTITSPSPLPSGEINLPYMYTFTATNGVQPFSNWQIQTGGPPPTGLTLSPSGILSGPPSQSGDFSFTVCVTDSAGTQGCKPFLLHIYTFPVITTSSPLPPCTQSVVCTPLTFGVSGGSGGDMWNNCGGAPPPNGLTLSVMGTLTGTPTAAPGTYSFEVCVTDSLGATAGPSNFQITITQFQGQWIQLQPTGTPPAARADAAAVFVPSTKVMLIFGGNTAGCTSAPSLNDTWMLTNVNGASQAWKRLNPTGTLPPIRSGHSAVYAASSDRMIVFGGEAAGCSPTKYNDVWLLENASGRTGTRSWVKLAVAGTLPPARSDHTAIYDTANNQMIVFGGDGPSSKFKDLWVLKHSDGTGGTPRWVKLTPTGAGPSATSFNGSTYDPSTNTMTVFAGWQCCSGPSSNQVFLLSNANGLGGTPGWTLLSVAGSAPTARVGPQAIYKPSPANWVVYFAGSNTNDAWVLSNPNGIGSPRWLLDATVGTPPPTRGGVAANPASAYDAGFTQNWFIFGGMSGTTMLNDVWLLSPVAR